MKIGNNQYRLQHNLNPIFEKLEAFRSRKQLENSAIYRQYRTEILRIERGCEWKNTHSETPARRIIRVVAWNVERGRNLDGIIQSFKSDPILSRADVILLTETDIGMGRSGNYNIPLEIADALEMNYCFANSFIVLSKGDEGEQDHASDNTLSMHGTAILSRYEISAFKTIPLYPVKEYFTTFEKRLGERRGLICTIRIGGELFDFAAVHLELKTSPKQRARQLESLLRPIRQSNSCGIILGGDLNTHTYNLHSRLQLMLSFFYKALFLGFPGAIYHYMHPDEFFEKPTFRMLHKYGFDIDAFNDKSRGTLHYDVNDSALIIKAHKWVPAFLYRWLQKRLEPWEGCVPFRLDWLAGRGFRVLERQNGVYGPPQVIEIPQRKNLRISDHHPIVADVLLDLD